MGQEKQLDSKSGDQNCGEEREEAIMAIYILTNAALVLLISEFSSMARKCV